MKKGLKSLFIMLLFLLGFNVQASANMEVHFLNVGQGDSTLITCDGQSLLIDAGGNDDVDPVLNYIQNKQGLSRLDYIIGTHPHEDHIGAMDSVIDAVEIGEVILPDVTTDTDTFMDVLTAIENKGLGITVPELGETYQLGSGSFTIIAPVTDYGNDLNNWSIGVRVEYGNTSFLFTGDAESSAENDILSTGATLDSDVFKIAHHGSETSNSDAFLSAVSPEYGVISCGADNSYGHPNQSVIDRLNASGVKLFRTDAQGTIVAKSDGNTITWSTDPTSDFSSGDEEEATVISGSGGGSFQGGAAEDNSSSGGGVIVHITETGSKYHSAGCSYLKSDIPISLSDAKAQGYEPCSRCNPPR